MFYKNGTIVSIQFPQRMFTCLVARTLWPQRGQMYFRVLLGHCMRRACAAPMVGATVAVAVAMDEALNK